MNVLIRKGTISDLPHLQQLFVDTVSTICQSDYNQQQIQVWTASIKNKERWLGIVIQQFLLVAEHNGEIVGFASLDKGNYVDMLYIHKAMQRQRIAHKLYMAIETEAKNQGQTRLIAEVSITAKPFFEKVGFSVIKEQRVERAGIALSNFKMEKQIA